MGSVSESPTTDRLLVNGLIVWTWCLDGVLPAWLFGLDNKLTKQENNHLEAVSVVDSAESTTPLTDTPGSRGRRLVALTAISGLLAACGGGGGSEDASTGTGSGTGGGSGSTPAPPPAPGSPGAGEEPVYEQDGPVTEKRASRFLGQASLGATEAEIAKVVEIGFEAWLDEQMGVGGNGSRYDWMVEQGYLYNGSIFTLLGSDQSLWFKLFTSPDTLRQRIALALSEIFVINGSGITGAGDFRNFGVAAYMDLLETYAFGNYRTLLEEVTLSHQMGAFLSMRGSRKAESTGQAPDENYAREILQLFSIGLYKLNLDGTYELDGNGQPIETYSNDDIVGLARAFTGWDADTSVQVPERWRARMVLDPANHEPREKSFLGLTIPAGTDGETSMRLALDWISQHQNVAPFIARQLIQRLVTSNPSSYYVRRVAEAFNDNGDGIRGDLGAVVKAVLLDPEARLTVLSNSIVGKVREPMLRFVHWARSFNASGNGRQCDVSDMSSPSVSLGQSPLRSDSVFNFFRPGFTPPNTELGNAGYSAPELQIASEVSVIGYANFMTNVIRSGMQGVRSDYVQELALVNDPSALLDRLDLLLTAGQLTDQTRSMVLTTISALPVETDEDRRVRVNAAILLVMISSDYLVQK